MGSYNSPDGSVHHLSVELTNVNKNRNDEGVRPKFLDRTEIDEGLKLHRSYVQSFFRGICRGRILSWCFIAFV